MNLTYNNNLLTIDEGCEKIDSASAEIKLSTDLDDVFFFGILTLQNGVTKTIQFVKRNKLYYSKLIIQEHELAVIKDASFKLKIVSASFDMTSDSVYPVFDIASINLSVAKYHDYEMAELHKEISALKQALESLGKGYALGIKIKGDDSYVKPGMIPVALGNGEFIAAYPFQDTVKKINGKEPVDNSVEITPYDIPHRDGTLNDYLSNLTKALSEISEFTINVASQLSDLRDRVYDLDYRFETYKNKGTL